MQAILKRAMDADYAIAQLTKYTDNDLINLVDMERTKELCFEGQIFFDITRRKQDLIRENSTNSSAKRINYPSDYFILPIPLTELNANKKMQPNPTVNN